MEPSPGWSEAQPWVTNRTKPKPPCKGGGAIRLGLMLRAAFQAADGWAGVANPGLRCAVRRLRSTLGWAPTGPSGPRGAKSVVSLSPCVLLPLVANEDIESR